MRKSFFIITLLILIFVILPRGVWAAFFRFDQSSLSVNTGDTFQVKVLIDTEGEEVNAAQAYVRFDSNLLSVESVVGGDFFDEVSYSINASNVYVAGLLSNIGVGKSGSGELATITFKATTSGSITLDFICDPSVVETSSIVQQQGVEIVELINCSSNGTLALDIGGGGTTSEPTATPTSAPAQEGGGDTSPANQGSGTAPAAGSTSTPKGGDAANQATNELPRAGVADHLFLYLLSGGFLLLVGFGLKNLR